ncbi:MAG: hypothetical protein GQ583_01595 [Methyloprofundus sp.]|nr:hypothetical protein [Methyloprofundus sp.]
MKANIKKSVIGMASVTGITMMSLFSTAAMASNAGAFIGGLVTSRVLQNMHQRTQAEEYAAYSKPQTTTAVKSAPGHSPAESKLKELDDLANKGYITPAEYKSRRRAIIDGI